MSTDLMAVDVLSDEYMLKILHLTSEEPLSVADLCTMCDINGAACFRRIMDLKRMGLLDEISSDTGPDEEEVLFSSNIKRIEVQFKDGLIFCKIEGSEGSEELDCLDPLSGDHRHWTNKIEIPRERSGQIPWNISV
jgi:hypothetical protein